MLDMMNKLLCGLKNIFSTSLAVVTALVFVIAHVKLYDGSRPWQGRGIRLRVSTSSSYKPGTSQRWKSYHLTFNAGAGYKGGATLTYVPVGRFSYYPWSRVHHWIGLFHNVNRRPFPGLY